MDFNLSDDQQQLADSLGRVLSDHYGFEQRRAVAASAAGWSLAVWAQLAELGVTALGITDEFGGLGGDAADHLQVMQAAGRALWLEPYLASAVLGSTAVRECGSQEQKQALLPALARGDLRLAWAHDEAAARHRPLWVQTRARRSCERWLLDGRKSLVLHAQAAGCFVVSARVGDAAGEDDKEGDAADGLALFLVDAGGPGTRLRPYRLVDDTPAGELILDGATAQPLGDPADGARALAAIRATLAAGTAAVCADMVGTMETAFRLTTEYVHTRQQFGRVIGEYQALRHRVAEMAVQLELARSMAIAAAVAVGDDESDLQRAKLLIGHYARALCQCTIQLHGGIGMTEEYAVGHCLRRVHVMDQLFGDVQAQVERLARREGCAG